MQAFTHEEGTKRCKIAKQPKPALRNSCAGMTFDSSDMLRRFTAPVRARMSGRRRLS